MENNNKEYRRLIVFFDLPTVTKAEKRTARIFRKNLISNGFSMMQYSIYSRFCHSLSVVETQISRLMKYVPAVGYVRVLIITEKQYENMIILVGNFKKEEEIISQQLTFL